MEISHHKIYQKFEMHLNQLEKRFSVFSSIGSFQWDEISSALNYNPSYKSATKSYKSVTKKLQNSMSPINC